MKGKGRIRDFMKHFFWVFLLAFLLLGPDPGRAETKPNGKPPHGPGYSFSMTPLYQNSADLDQAGSFLSMPGPAAFCGER